MGGDFNIAFTNLDILVIISFVIIGVTHFLAKEEPGCNEAHLEKRPGFPLSLEASVQAGEILVIMGRTCREIDKLNPSPGSRTRPGAGVPDGGRFLTQGPGSVSRSRNAERVLVQNSPCSLHDPKKSIRAFSHRDREKTMNGHHWLRG
jgi:hypothetical protein